MGEATKMNWDGIGEYYTRRQERQQRNWVHRRGGLFVTRHNGFEVR